MRKTLLALMTLAAAAAMAQTTVSVNLESGTLYRGGTGTAQTWNSHWISDQSPVVTLCPADGSTTNNISYSGQDLILAQGSNYTYSFSLSVESGYHITATSGSVTTNNGDPTVSIAGADGIACTSEAQAFSVSGLDTKEVTITITSANTANSRVLFTDWTVTVAESEVTTDPGITLSTDQEQHWYYITSASTKSYCKGLCWYADESAGYLRFAAQQYLGSYLWSFWQGDDGQLAIKNYDGGWVGLYASNTNYLALQDEPSYTYAVAFYEDGAWSIYDSAYGNYVHAQENGTVLVHWNLASGNASLWAFEEADVAAMGSGVTLGSTTVEQGKVTTGIGNRNVPILRSTMVLSGLDGTATLGGVSGKVVATDLADVTGVRAYLADNARELYIDDGTMPWRETNGTLYAEGTIDAEGNYTIAGEAALEAGTYYLWVCLDISGEATEGNTVDATITAYTVDGESVAETSGDPTYSATIFLAESAPLMPMDLGKLYWRIPAITTSADGQRIVILTDERGTHNSDLPYQVYVVAQYSEDGGLSWSEPLYVAGTSELGGAYGHGDASLITNRINGDIIGIMTSSPYGLGFFGATPDKPQGWKVIKSTDGGLTWSAPVDHTASLYGTGSPNPDFGAGFSGSGAGLQKRDGTLVSPFVARDTNSVNHYYNIMSKDGGDTWFLYGVDGCQGSDEPKILERNNGDLALSSRATGYNYYNYTEDDGLTWKLSTTSPTRFTSGITGNACDGEYMVWCSTLDGNEQDIVLQTGPYNSSRMNVSIALSTDEGKTFGTPKTICPRGSAYSAATVLPDGTLGVYYEENGLYGGFTMRFVRFSLDWASDGAYKFTADSPYRPVQSNVSYTMPDYEWNTVILPFDAAVPEGLAVYEAQDSTLAFVDEDGAERTAILLAELPTDTLAAFTPYVLSGPEGTYELARGEWYARQLGDSCQYTSGPLVGHLVGHKVYGDGATIYNNFKNIASRGGVGLNRITEGSCVAATPYCCTVRLTTPSDLTLMPRTADQIPPATDGVRGVSVASGKAYTLGGLPRQPGQRGVFVIDGKTILIQ